MKTFLRKLGWWLTRRRRQQDLDDELRAHLEADEAEQVDAGTTSAEAHRRARVDFGNLALAREDTRAAWGWPPLEQVVQDVRYAVRMMRRTPAFVALATLSLALGIGVNTALFSFADVMLLRGLPVRDAAALVRMTWRTPQNEMHGISRHGSAFSEPGAGFTSGVFSYPAFLEFQRQHEVFSHVFAYQGTGALTLNATGQSEAATGEYVTGDYFSGLGVLPIAGRVIDGSDDRIGGPSVAVLSFAFARDHFAKPADAVGRTIVINTVPFSIIGVAPPGFFGTDPARVVALYLPLHANVQLEPSASAATARYGEPSTWWLEIMARRQAGVSLERAQAVLAPAFQRTSEELKATSRRWSQAPALALRAGDTGIDSLSRTYGRPLVLLIALAALILALACANIANLLLARASARRREIAVRLSVGAGRARVARQLVTESLTLSCLGGALGIAIAVWTQGWLTALVTNGLAPVAVQATLNAKALAVAVGLSMLTGLLFGLAPALHATRGDTLPALKDTRAIPGSGRRGYARRGLLVVQVAITLLILVAAGLFLRTIRNYQAIDRGYSTDHVLTMTLRTQQAGLNEDQALAFFSTVREKLGTLPGVRRVGLSDIVLLGDGGSQDVVVPAGSTANGRKSSVILNVDGGLFATMQLTLLSGRGIDATDERPGAPLVAVIDETYARQFFGGTAPIGQFVTVPGSGAPARRFEVIGIAANARVADLTGARQPTVYFPYTANVFGPPGGMDVVMRTEADPLRLAAAARGVVTATNPNVPVARLMTQDSLIDGMFNREILLARLCSALGLLALTIAIVGLYGTVLQDVARRRNEIGIRIALGARRGQVVLMVLREVLIVVTIGAVIGIAAASVVTRAGDALLFGVTRYDPVTMALAIALLVSSALVAGFIPARAASRLNPTVALRVD